MFQSLLLRIGNLLVSVIHCTLSDTETWCTTPLIGRIHKFMLFKDNFCLFAHHCTLNTLLFRLDGEPSWSRRSNPTDNVNPDHYNNGLDCGSCSKHERNQNIFVGEGFSNHFVDCFQVFFFHLLSDVDGLRPVGVLFFDVLHSGFVHNLQLFGGNWHDIAILFSNLWHKKAKNYGFLKF